MKNNMYVYILITAVVTYSLRAIPNLLLKKEIKNNFVRSFLYYVPYVTLASMTFPAIIYDTKYKIAGLLSLILGSLLAWKNGSLLKVAITCSATVFIVEYVISNYII